MKDISAQSKQFGDLVDSRASDAVKIRGGSFYKKTEIAPKKSNMKRRNTIK